MYSYEEQRPKLIDDNEGIVTTRIVHLVESIKPLIEASGAITMTKAIEFLNGVSFNFEQYAYIDRLCELGYLQELERANDGHFERVFLAGYRWMD